MKVNVSKVIGVLLFVFLLSNGLIFSQSSKSHRVLLIAREVSEDMGFMIKNEVNPMIELLNSAGYQVDIADESGNAISADGRTQDVSLKFNEVNLSNYSGILVPCIMAFGSLSKSVPQGAVNLSESSHLLRE